MSTLPADTPAFLSSACYDFFYPDSTPMAKPLRYGHQGHNQSISFTFVECPKPPRSSPRE